LRARNAFEPKVADMNTRSSRYPLNPLLRRCIALAAAGLLTGMAGMAAAAQYQWRDDRGRMVYSDLPPPASVAPARILRAPEPPPAAATIRDPGAAASPGARSAAVAAAAASTPAPAPATAADQEFAFRKRMADRAEEEKKAAEAADREVKLAKACADAQGDIRSLESGQRISRINAAGEREFLSEAERTERLRNARKSVSERC
jgi:hypothetical protein